MLHGSFSGKKSEAVVAGRSSSAAGTLFRGKRGSTLSLKSGLLGTTAALRGRTLNSHSNVLLNILHARREANDQESQKM